MTLDDTHDPARRSWYEPANDPSGDFPIQNLPFGVFSRKGHAPRCGIAIGDAILDVCHVAALIHDETAREAAVECEQPALNALMRLGAGARKALRAAVSHLLSEKKHKHAVGAALVRMADATMHLPVAISNYTDFYSSIHHATNVGKLFRPDNPLLPNYKWIPIAYHGRASSIRVSGHAFHRPKGQLKPPNAETPVYAPSKSLDYELELGFYIGAGNELGDPVTIGEADAHIFGFSLLNDWSARDIQAWEYQPLGPFLAKNFATTVSPWVVTMDALTPYRMPAVTRGDDDPLPLPYLRSDDDQREGAIDIRVEAYLETRTMVERKLPPHRLSDASFASNYWTPAQMVTQHSSNGCNLEVGDLFGTGTISGPGHGASGSLIELTARGTQPVSLSSGEKRGFLEDGDTVILRAHCEREGRARIGFGECRATVLPAN